MKYNPGKVFQNTITIKRYHNPSLEEFQTKIVPAQTPVIISGAMDKWLAYNRWTNAYLREKVGKLTIKLSEAKRGVHFDEKVFVANRSASFAEFIESLDGDIRKVANLYVMQMAIPEDIPQLKDDVEFPIYVDRKTAQSPNVWIGPGGNVTPLHFDVSENFLSQVRGKKTVLLFPPGEASKLYPYPIRKGLAHLSRINIADPDTQEFPAVRNARCGVAHIDAGDMLYIPSFWWHGVFGYDQNISLNFWWRRPTIELFRKYPKTVVSMFLSYYGKRLQDKILAKKA